MVQEIVIAVGIPFSGRTTWLNNNYKGDDVVVFEEDKFEGLVKNGKIQESSFISSNEWVSSQVAKVFELVGSTGSTSTESTGSEQTQTNKVPNKIVVSYFQSRPDHWIPVLELGIKHGCTVNIVTPKNGYLYYQTNKFGRNQEQADWIEKSTLNRFPHLSREQRKKIKTTGSKDEEMEIPNENLYHNIVVEYQSAYSFYAQNKGNCGTDPKKWLDLIKSNYKPVITKLIQTKEQLAIKAKKQAEKAVREAEKAAKEAAEKAEKAARLAEKEKKVFNDAESDDEETQVQASA